MIQKKGGTLDEEERALTKNLTENGELPQSQRKEVPRLFVEADGTFIHLQKEGKKTGEIKLLLSHEGWERKGKDRYQLKSKKILCGFHSAEDTWDRFTGRLLKSYHPDVLSSLIIGGDGASWVKGGTELFKGSIYQLDRFHLRRALLRATGKIKIANRTFGLAVRGNLNEALTVLEEEAKIQPDRRGDLLKAATYLKASAKGLVDYRQKIEEKDENMRALGAIESNIDKILANRMKKRGMSWTLKGAHHMAKVIQMRENGELGKESLSIPQTIEARLKKALNKVKQSFEEAPGFWLRARMPALSGPHQGRPWVKMLRNLSNLSHADEVRNFLPTKS